MITVSSIFRDAASHSHGFEPHLDRYFSQITELRELCHVRLVLGEGDQSDNTGYLLREMIAPGDTVITVDHGGPHFESIDHPQRWQQIAQVVRGVVDHVGDPGDAYIWVEGDLIWDAETMVSLMEANRCVAPLVYAKGNPARLYDTWGARQGGQMFLSHPPYFPHGWPVDERYVKVDSCGSCFVVPGDQFEVVKEWDGVWPFPAGGRLFYDSHAAVAHP